jgi:hypothetical protein
MEHYDMKPSKQRDGKAHPASLKNGINAPARLALPVQATPRGPRATEAPLNRIVAGSLLGGGAALLIAGIFPAVYDSVPAVGLVLMVFGLVCTFPTVLTDGSAQVSAIRVVVLLVTCAFVLLVVKHGWSTPGAKIDAAWKTILAAALGGKAVQSFAESIGGSPGTPPRLGAPNYDSASTTRPGVGTSG